MYIPKIHKGLSEEAALAFVQKYSFATVVANAPDHLEIVHIPLEVHLDENKLVLSGHVARGNKIAQSISSQGSVTCVFREPHAYISSSWYDHVNVPTWNYIAIHMKGSFRAIEGQELLDSLHKMVDHYEEGRKDRYQISDMPQDMLEAHLKGLVGFVIEVKEIEANYKLSQNRNNRDYAEIITQLSASDYLWEKEIAQEMRTLRPDLNE